MLMDLTPVSKDTFWQTGFKKIQQSIVFRRPISLTETSTGLFSLKVKGWKKIYQANGP
jgi:hypothetical protein